MSLPTAATPRAEVVSLQVDHDIAVVTINRPAVRNAIDLATAQAIAVALDEVDSRDEVRVAVLTGAGGFFSAGMDLKAYSTRGERPLVEGRGAFGICERATEKPLIAAVEGTALGGGFEIALACDLVVAAEDARFGLPEVKRGLVAAAGGLLRLPRSVPRNVALELVMTGEPMTAQRAQELGLVSRLAPSGDALRAALILARTIAENAPLAVVASKQLALASADWPANEFFERQRYAVDRVRASADAAEGARAFTEKRRPLWTGA